MRSDLSSIRANVSSKSAWVILGSRARGFDGIAPVFRRTGPRVPAFVVLAARSAMEPS